MEDGPPLVGEGAAHRDPGPLRADRDTHPRITSEGRYPGPLLGAEESPWIAKPRDALRARFVRTLSRLGEQLERQHDFATAIDLYRRGLEVDNLAEPLYRGLMRALAATGDHAEALNAFRRCRDLLSIVLSIKPSAETERLYREIAGRL